MSEKSLRRIEQKLIIIERRLGDLSSQLRSAVNYRQSDPQSALTKSRIILEKLLRDIYQKELGASPDIIMIGQLLSNKALRTKLPRRMLAKMNIIREMANLGAHGDEVLPSDAERVILDLFEVIDWYSDTYLPSDRSSVDTFQVGRELLPEFVTRLRYPLRGEVVSIKLTKTTTDVYLQITLRHQSANSSFPWAGDSTETTKRFNLAQVLLSSEDFFPLIKAEVSLESNEAKALELCDDEVFWVLDSDLFSEEASEAILGQLIEKDAVPESGLSDPSEEEAIQQH